MLLGHAGKVGKLCSAMETDSVQKFDMAVLGLRQEQVVVDDIDID